MARRLSDRFAEHLCSVRNNDVDKPVARYFNAANHSISDIIFTMVMHRAFLKDFPMGAACSLTGTFMAKNIGLVYSIMHILERSPRTPLAPLKSRRSNSATLSLLLTFKYNIGLTVYRRKSYYKESLPFLWSANFILTTIRLGRVIKSDKTDLKNRTGSNIYCWEIEANGGHIGVTTWGVQWRHRAENENFDIFYLKLTNEMCSLDIN